MNISYGMDIITEILVSLPFFLQTCKWMKVISAENLINA